MSMYTYSILKLQSDFDKNRLIYVLMWTNYLLFGFTLSFYITVLNLIAMYYKIIPRLGLIIISKINCPKTLIMYYQKYQIDRIRKTIIWFGDIIMNFVKMIFIAVLLKYNPTIDIKKNKVEKIEDYKETEDELKQIEKINSELDKLLNIGSTVVSAVVQGKKETQTENVEKFMNGFGSLMNDLKGDKKNE